MLSKSGMGDMFHIYDFIRERNGGIILVRVIYLSFEVVWMSGVSTDLKAMYIPRIMLIGSIFTSLTPLYGSCYWCLLWSRWCPYFPFMAEA